MAKYVALLRGVNVGGRVIKMAELKVCFEKLGFENVKTWLHSGNVTFESPRKATELEKLTEDTLSRTFNYPAKVWVLSAKEVAKIVEANPYTSAPANFHQYVIFFKNGLEKDFIADAKELDTSDVELGRGVVYWQVEKGETLTNPRGKLMTKAKYKNFNTNRNVNTLKRLI